MPFPGLGSYYGFFSPNWTVWSVFFSLLPFHARTRPFCVRSMVQGSFFPCKPTLQDASPFLVSSTFPSLFPPLVTLPPFSVVSPGDVLSCFPPSWYGLLLFLFYGCTLSMILGPPFSSPPQRRKRTARTFSSEISVAHPFVNTLFKAPSFVCACFIVTSAGLLLVRFPFQ